MSFNGAPSAFHSTSRLTRHNSRKEGLGTWQVMSGRRNTPLRLSNSSHPLGAPTLIPDLGELSKRWSPPWPTGVGSGLVY